MLKLDMGKCRYCNHRISGHGRQYCSSCSTIRKKDTNKVYWDKISQNKKLLTCQQCSIQYPIRPGRPSLRHLCPNCALLTRKQNRLIYDRNRWPKKREKRNQMRNRETSRIYKRNHPEWNRKKSAEYKHRHPEKVRQWQNARRTKKVNALGNVTMEEFWAKCETLNWRCLYCDCLLTPKTATMDHVIPLSGGGSGDISNIVPACRSCNARKSNHLIPYSPNLF